MFLTLKDWMIRIPVLLCGVFTSLTFLCAQERLNLPDLPSRPEPLFSNDTITINFFGDIMMHSLQIEKAGQGDGTYCFDTYFSHLEGLIESADINVANLEFSLGGKPYTGYPSFSAPDEFATHIAESGFDIFLAANNHISDKGLKGMSRTLERYRQLVEKYGILYTGIAENQKELDKTTPLFIVCNGIRLALINATYGTNFNTGDSWPKTNLLHNKSLLKTAFEKAKSKADVIIALVHWGEEYKLTNSPSQKETALWLAEAGADVIIGAHPHVAQNYETLNTDRGLCQVAYSLGNLVSNMSAVNTQIGMMANLKIARDPDGDIRVLPLEFNYLWCSRPGGYIEGNYCVIPIDRTTPEREEWFGAWEYDKMMTTYKRVSETIRIKNEDE